MAKTNDTVLSLRLHDAALAELTERAQYVGKTRSRFARELIMKGKCAKFCVCQVLEGGGRNLSPLFYDVG